MGKKHFFEVEGLKLQPADKTAPPTLLENVDDSFFADIGKLIVRFSTVERELNILTWALIAHNKTQEPGWRQSQFTKRFSLLQSEWAKFAKASPGLQQFIRPTIAKIRHAKVLRDNFAHNEATLGAMSQRGPFVQFYNKNRAKQKSKRFFKADLESASAAALQAAGELHWITDPSSNWPLSSQDKSLLRSLPSTDHFRAPKLGKRSVRP